MPPHHAMGAADRLRDATDAPRQPSDQVIFDRFLILARSGRVRRPEQTPPRAGRPDAGRLDTAIVADSQTGFPPLMSGSTRWTSRRQRSSSGPNPRQPPTILATLSCRETHPGLR
jgi:hypothetical protein